MCKQEKGLTVSTLLDYMLAGDKYGLTTFLEAAVKFCAHVDFDLLNGKTFTSCYKRIRMSLHKIEQEDKDISSKFSKLELKTQYAISKKRLQRMERCRRNSDPVEDYTIALS